MIFIISLQSLPHHKLFIIPEVFVLHILGFILVLILVLFALRILPQMNGKLGCVHKINFLRQITDHLKKNTEDRKQRNYGIETTDTLKNSQRWDERWGYQKQQKWDLLLKISRNVFLVELNWIWNVFMLAQWSWWRNNSHLTKGIFNV